MIHTYRNFPIPILVSQMVVLHMSTGQEMVRMQWLLIRESLFLMDSRFLIVLSYFVWICSFGLIGHLISLVLFCMIGLFGLICNLVWFVLFDLIGLFGLIGHLVWFVYLFRLVIWHIWLIWFNWWSGKISYLSILSIFLIDIWKKEFIGCDDKSIKSKWGDARIFIEKRQLVKLNNSMVIKKFQIIFNK